MRITEKISTYRITGFLGAGKTTFINQLLKANPDTQFALVENEFGEVAIDTKLIKGVEASQMFELKQGCICCTISDEYELVLQELAERFPNVEHLLIETTGVADPAPVVQPFFRDENLIELFDYNGIICLVDGLNFKDQPEKEISLKQLAIADHILVNKSDQISEKALFQNNLQKINPFAKIQFVEYGKASIELNAIEVKMRSEFDFIRLLDSHSQIQTKTISYAQPLNKNEFIRWLKYTLDIYKSQIYRTKGIIYFQNDPFEYILQGMGGSFELIEGDLAIGETVSALVFIGKLNDILI